MKHEHILHFGTAQCGTMKGLMYARCLTCTEIVWGTDTSDIIRTLDAVPCERRKLPKIICLLCRRDATVFNHAHLDASDEEESRKGSSERQ